MAKAKSASVTLTKTEIDALRTTAGQMEDDLTYYNFMPKPEYKAFCKAYETGMAKLHAAFNELDKKTKHEKIFPLPRKSI